MAEHTLDAANKVLGRIASEAAIFLRGKNRPDFDPSRFSGDRVTIVNTDRVRVTGRKEKEKIYRRHSGFHGGLKEESLERVRRRDSRLLVSRAVAGMLPKNRLRARFMKNLILIRGAR